MQERKIIYQVFTRTFGNRNTTKKTWGTLQENGVGKMADFTPGVLKQIKSMGCTDVWYTGVIRHATTTDYSRYGIPRQHAQVVKGKAGSPYAITDYYDIDPDIAVDVNNRMEEFLSLIKRTHAAGLKVIIDFVPNHVAREYKSIVKPEGVRDLGEEDDVSKHFDSQNNFYYCPSTALDLSDVLSNAQQSVQDSAEADYREYPAKCTGNDHFDAKPGVNDWYETVKLNYGIDYCDLGGRSEHFDPIPSTWLKMTEILLYWASRGVDGFRCDMAEMVPTAFWNYAIDCVKEKFPCISFIGEVYNLSLYRHYIAAGFDYLYDKCGMYDCLRNIIASNDWANDITKQWQRVDDIREHMLYFLENHDEQRIASDFFARDGKKAIPALVVMSLLGSNPVMIYAGQEFGEKGMDAEGFSGEDGRSTIFDYWSIDAVRTGFFSKKELSVEQKNLAGIYNKVLGICNTEAAIREGVMFDLMYANQHKANFHPQRHYAFMRKHDHEVIIVIADFGDKDENISVTIPRHAFEYLHMEEQEATGIDLLTSRQQTVSLKKDGEISFFVKGYNAVVFKMNAL